MLRRLSLGCLLLAALCPWAPASAQDGGRLLRSRDVQERLEGVRLLEGEGGEKAAAALADALKDKDWEVAERAAQALASVGTEKTTDDLIAVLSKHPSRRIRRAAARALISADLSSVGESLAKLVRGKLPVAPAEALADLALAADAGADLSPLREGLEKAFRSRDVPVRVAAAAGVVAFQGDERGKLLQAFFEDELEIAAAALEAVAVRPRTEDGPVLLQRLTQPALNDVLERRLRTALVAVASLDSAAGLAPYGAGLKAAPGTVRARFVRLLGDLGQPPRKISRRDPDRPPALDAATLLPALQAALSDPDGAVRSAALRSVQAVGDAAGQKLIAAALGDDPSPAVRDVALRCLRESPGVGDEATRGLLRAALKDDGPRVREDAAVALGDPAAADCAPDLVAALEDAEWGVAACAAVSLGKTGAADIALPALLALREHRDPHRAAAALVGLGHLSGPESVAQLLAALESRRPTERQVALAFLNRMSPRRVGDDAKAWRSWWEENETDYEFPDRQAAADKAQKYADSPNTEGVYEDLDVLAFQSRGDHIEQLLTKLKIQHRRTELGKVPESGVQPLGIYVANCTGECQPEDIEELTWFVKTGGYLFGSCWALEHTIARVYPGLVRRLPTAGQVLDNVIAAPCSPDSPFLRGVFQGDERPVYRLEGSFLIEVLDPARVEVLIDSPQAASHWGGGNLACWFQAGHGLILDSANHFDLQGLDRIDGLKRPEDRMAWAVDHMGVDWADLRELNEQKVWGKAAKAAELVEDLSAFTFLTNFVRHKRRNDR